MAADAERAGTGLLLAIAAIFILLGAYFQSLRIAIVVMATIPAVLAGVSDRIVVAETRSTCSRSWGNRGLGVAVANAILLTTFAERARLAGASPADAAIEGAQAASADPDDDVGDDLGMLPLALGAAQTAPLGRAVIEACWCTLATLFVLPASFALVQSRARRAHRRWTPTMQNLLPRIRIAGGHVSERIRARGESTRTFSARAVPACSRAWLCVDCARVELEHAGHIGEDTTNQAGAPEERAVPVAAVVSRAVERMLPLPGDSGVSRCRDSRPRARLFPSDSRGPRFSGQARCTARPDRCAGVEGPTQRGRSEGPDGGGPAGRSAGELTSSAQRSSGSKCIGDAWCCRWQRRRCRPTKAEAAGAGSKQQQRRRSYAPGGALGPRLEATPR